MANAFSTASFFLSS